MGCIFSLHRRKVSDGVNNMSVQDEARSFRSKVEAIRFMTKNLLSRHAFQQYLEQNHAGVEYLQCFIDLDELKALNDDKLIPQTTMLLSKYQALCENAEKVSTADAANIVVINLWEKLRRLRILDIKKITRKDLLSTVIAVQNQILGELATPFESFLDSTMYRVWQEDQLKAEKGQGKHAHPAGNHIQMPNRAAATDSNVIVTSSGKWLTNSSTAPSSAPLTSRSVGGKSATATPSGAGGSSPVRSAAGTSSAQREGIENLTNVMP